jgi:hypothetical protein
MIADSQQNEPARPATFCTANRCLPSGAGTACPWLPSLLLHMAFYFYFDASATNEADAFHRSPAGRPGHVSNRC